MAAPKSPTVWNTHILRKPDGTPFYVGKSKHARCPGHYASHALAQQLANTKREEIIRQIWDDGGDFICDIVLTSEDEAACIAKQKELIAELGRDNLCNNTDGGKGVTNYSNQITGSPRLSTRAKYLASKAKRE